MASQATPKPTQGFNKGLFLEGYVGEGERAR